MNSTDILNSFFVENYKMEIKDDIPCYYTKDCCLVCSSEASKLNQNIKTGYNTKYRDFICEQCQKEDKVKEDSYVAVALLCDKHKDASALQVNNILEIEQIQICAKCYKILCNDHIKPCEICNFKFCLDCFHKRCPICKLRKEDEKAVLKNSQIETILGTELLNNILSYENK